MGLPGSGKTTLANLLSIELKCPHFEADVIRKMWSDWDFSEDARIRQSHRMRQMCNIVEGKWAIADFVCPTETTRKLFDPDIIIWMDTNNSDHKQYEDTNSMFQKPKKPDFHVKTKQAEANVEFILKRIDK